MPVPTLTIGSTRLEMARGDITAERTDAIVNAANSGLAGGGGVDGAIHFAGGPEIMKACRAIGRCPTGKAVITTAGKLQAQWVIHAVGPIFAGLKSDAVELASAYRESLDRARESGAKSVAFPSLSTGAYGYPIREAAPIAIDTVVAEVKKHPDAFALIRFILFSDGDYSEYFSQFTKRGAKRA